MCGIAGRIELTSGHVSQAKLQAMTDKIVHRGPDDQGIYISKNKKVGLAFTRLAIIDLSPKGHQPMSYKGRYWISFNGEIYNYKQERQKLVTLGYKFKSASDTEVILALYDKYGPACVNHLRGMFALAIYDEKLNTVFITRDRMGVKPLKYYLDGNVFIFASELKAILTQPEVKVKPDWEAINHYLSFGYCPAPLTGFLNINKLEPGHSLLINLNSGQISKQKYWQLDFSHKLDLSENEWSEKILSELEAATKMRMVADVPVGAFLSGGVDSSAVVALMARNSKKAIKTFTIGFEDKIYDESRYAQTIADMYHTDHSILIAKPRSVESLPDLVAHYEEPFADSSAVITTMVSELARQQVTVVLNGDGSDESFGGYLRHTKLKRDFQLAKYKHLLDLSKPILAKWPRAKKFLNRQDEDIRQRYASYYQYFSPEEKFEIYTKNVKRDSMELWFAKCEQAGVTDVRDALMYADLSNYYADSQLVKVDIGSMKHGLEARSPFTDHKFMELVASIPYDLKVKNGQNKYILKKALESIVPLENLYRPKMGFTIPLSKWFEGELKTYTKSRLGNKHSILGEFINKSAVNKMLREHTQQNDYGPRLWALLTLQLWWEHYFT